MLPRHVHGQSSEGRLWQVVDKGEVKTRSLDIRDVPAVTAQRRLRGNLKRDGAMTTSSCNTFQPLLSALWKRLHFHFITWQLGQMNPVYSALWVVSEKEQHTDRHHHSYAVSLKCPPVLLPQFSKYGQMSWRAWSKNTHSHIKAHYFRTSWSGPADILLSFCSITVSHWCQVELLKGLCVTVSSNLYALITLFSIGHMQADCNVTGKMRPPCLSQLISLLQPCQWFV